jgi:hypothetical protein
MGDMRLLVTSAPPPSRSLAPLTHLPTTVTTDTGWMISTSPAPLPPPPPPPHAHTHNHACTHTRRHARTHAHAHTRTHTHTNTQTHTRARARTHNVVRSRQPARLHTPPRTPHMHNPPPPLSTASSHKSFFSPPALPLSLTPFQSPSESLSRLPFPPSLTPLSLLIPRFPPLLSPPSHSHRASPACP